MANHLASSFLRPSSRFLCLFGRRSTLVYWAEKDTDGAPISDPAPFQATGTVRRAGGRRPRAASGCSLLSLCGLLLLGSVGRGASTGEGQVFNVRNFGATGDGRTLDTPAIQKALDACGKAGGGTVLFPAGTYLSHPLRLRNKTTVRLETGAKLQATDDPADFHAAGESGAGSFIPFIAGKKLMDVTLAGPGIIDGAGARWWVPAEEARRKKSGYTLPRPNLIVLSGCRNVRVENITLQNSPKFHFVPTDCEDVVVSNVTILAPPRSPNTDAIDPSASRHVLITKCRIDVGDDNIAIKAGKKMPGRDFACEDILVTDCTFLHGHGMSIGSETTGGVRNVRVRNCTFENTENGIRIKSQRGKGGVVEDLEYSDITMSNVDPAITLTCYYMNNSAKDPGEPGGQPVETRSDGGDNNPVYRNIRISNLNATCERSAGVVLGLPDSPISNVVLSNVHISAATGMTVRNAKGIRLEDVKVIAKSGQPFITENAEITGLETAKTEVVK